MRYFLLLFTISHLSSSLLAQSNCSNPLNINAIPYSATGLSVSDAGDSGFCAGEDFFLKYTPAQNECISLSSDFGVPAIGGFACMSIYENCPTVSGFTLLGSDSQNNPLAFSGTLTINNVALSASLDYYIVYSISQSVTSTFNMDITSALCPPDCPSFSNPANQSSIVDASYLFWEDVGADSYDIYFDSGFTFYGSTTDTIIILPPLIKSTYKWRVIPVLNGISPPFTNCIERTFHLLDSDNDGVFDNQDLCINDQDPSNADSDEDQVGDACDNCPTEVNLNQLDIDNDQVGDLCDNCPETSNTFQLDDDNDGIGNLCDDDDDNDGIPDNVDNCPLFNNPNQEDSDQNGTGDACEVDLDGDGISNSEDNCVRIPNPNQEDGDNDSWGDACDNCPIMANPDQENMDGDVFGDVCDLCPTLANTFNADFDSDGIGDQCDGCPLIANTGQLDSEQKRIGLFPPYTYIPIPDGIQDACDNCPYTANPDQADTNNDGIGDACTFIDDNDGVARCQPGTGGFIPCLPLDNCAFTFNPGQEDGDNDNIGDVCDNCPNLNNADQSDLDGDGIGDVCDPDPDGDLVELNDNCPNKYNPGQEDLDGDGIGDICDNCPEVSNLDQIDSDSDNIADACDNCPSISNSAQVDTDGDGKGDFCDLDIDNDGIANINDNCPYIFNLDQGDIDGDSFGNLCDECPTIDNRQYFGEVVLKGPCPISDDLAIGINTSDPATSLHIKDGFLFIDTDDGLILKNDAGQCVRISISGIAISAQVIPCPEK